MATDLSTSLITTNMNAPASSASAFRGVWPAMLTPLQSDLSIDHGLYAEHAHALLAAGCGGVTAFGTTGEGPSFSMAERRAAIDALIARGVPASQIIVSTSCAALPETLELTRHATEAGVHGVLMLPPFFLKGVSDRGIADSYRWVIDRLADPRLRMYLYHIPQVAAVGLSHAVIRELLDAYPGTIVGIKDSACDRAHSVGLAQAFMPGITVYVGNETDLPTLGRLGSTGAISGLANFCPRLVHRLVMQPDHPGVENDLAQVNAILQALDGLSLMPAIKGVMAQRSGQAAWLRVRPPLVALDGAQQALLAQRMQAVAGRWDVA